MLVALMCAISAAGLWLLPELAIGWTLLFGFGSGATMIPRPDVYRPARQLGASGRGAVRDGRASAICWPPAGADGQDP